MDLVTVLIASSWSGLTSFSLGIRFTVPRSYVSFTFVCGFAGRFMRDSFMSWDISQNWATAVAAGSVALVAAALIRRDEVSPVVLVSGILPLSATTAIFHALIGLMKISALKGDALSEASVTLTANIAKVFTTSLSIVVGLGVGMAVVRLLRRVTSKATGSWRRAAKSSHPG